MSYNFIIMIWWNFANTIIVFYYHYMWRNISNKFIELSFYSKGYGPSDYIIFYFPEKPHYSIFMSLTLIRGTKTTCHAHTSSVWLFQKFAALLILIFIEASVSEAIPHPLPLYSFLLHIYNKHVLHPMDTRVGKQQNVSYHT